MHCPSPRLFALLRRHRGVWALALAVFLFKVAMATFCVLDGPRASTYPTATADSVTAVVATDATADDGDVCVLEEGKGCHCSCAHTVALPATAVPVIGGLPPVHLDALPSLPTRAGVTGSLFRPPIA